MNKIIVALFGVVLTFGTLLTPTVVHGQFSSNQSVQGGLNDLKSAFPDTVAGDGDPQDLVRNIIEWALYIGAMLAVLFIIYGGYLYLTSGGNDSQVKKGKETVIYALVGLVVIVMAWVIVQTVYNFLVN
ncbi:MAG: pilin [Candidatus Doudnabacteria bacterium]